MRALIHRSQHSSSRPDGWSGAPDEARYIGALIDRAIPIAAALGVEVLTNPSDARIRVSQAAVEMLIGPTSAGARARSWAFLAG